MIPFLLVTTFAAAQMSGLSHRVVSTSLCGDSYVLEIFAPKDIAALSWQSRSALSMAPEALKANPQARDDVETLLSLKPDLVIFGPGEGLKSSKYLDAANIPSIRLSWQETQSKVEDNIETVRKFAASQGIDVKAESPDTSPLSMAADKALTLKAPTLRAMYLTRSGGTAGSGTFVDDVLKSLGVENIIQTPGWVPAEPEFLVMADPDFIITSFYSEMAESAQSKGARNPAFKRLLETKPVIEVPGALWPCAGPGLKTAREILSQGLIDLGLAAK